MSEFPHEFESDFEHEFEIMAEDINDIAKKHGWWETECNDGELICLMHSELSEALEALRNGNPTSDKIPPFTNLEEELADCIIRIMDYGVQRNLNIAGAISEKICYNVNRLHKHGKEF